MKTYTVTIRVEADDDVNADQIREEIYDACPDVNFGFDIIKIHEEK
ncbi:hypothetical protein ACWEG1_05880 [Streptomyces bauhiniae]